MIHTLSNAVVAFFKSVFVKCFELCSRTSAMSMTTKPKKKRKEHFYLLNILRTITMPVFHDIPEETHLGNGANATVTS